MSNFRSALIYSLPFFILTACNQQKNEADSTKEQEEGLSAQSIVDRAIEAHGGDAFEASEISFKFRDFDYRSLQNGGQFTLDRISQNDSIGKITDRVTNSGYLRLLNEETTMDVVDSMQLKYTNSVNSVHYFARLPYGLNAPAVQKKFLGVDTIAGKPYYEVEVRFKQEGGGVDYQDVFVYWFQKEAATLDYLAYSYETDGGGVRFRAAQNPSTVGGIRFQDYINYKPEGLDVKLQDLDRLYQEDSLIEVSEIILENIQVKPIDNAL